MAEFFLNCNKCRQKLEVPDEWRGRLIACPACGAEMRVPQDGTNAVSADPIAPVGEAKMPAASGRYRSHSRIFGKFIFLLILLALAGTGLFFILKWAFFVRAGFHEVARLDNAVIMSSGHGFFLTAKNKHQDFSGKAATAVSGRNKWWISMQFKDGKADGVQTVYCENGEHDIIIAELLFEKGRLRKITAADGESSTVEYDFFDRPKMVDFKINGAPWKVSCRYRLSGALAATDASVFAGTAMQIKGEYSSSSLPVHADFFNGTGVAAGSAGFEYDEYDKLARYTFFNSKGKELKKPRVKISGPGLMDIIFYTLTL